MTPNNPHATPRAWLLLALIALIAMGCGGSDEVPLPQEVGAQGDAQASSETEADASGEAPSEGTDAPVAPTPTENPCPTGQVPGADGACMPVGIQGCAEMFIDPETGLCDPSPDDCPPGHIPIFSEGCQSVSIPGCVEEFMNAETGLCDPDPDACAPYHIPVPTEGCVSLDPPEGCGEGTWGNVALTDGDVHVDIAYTGQDSDGSREAPFTVIKDATDAVQDGGRVILAAGDYPEGVRITKSFQLVGRCASMVTISGAKATVYDFDAVIRVNKGVQASISDLTASGPGVGIFAYEDVTLTITRLALSENQGMGLATSGADTSLEVNQVLVARTQPSTGALDGKGVSVGNSATMTLTRSVIVDNHTSGLYGANEAHIEVHDVLIARTQPRVDGTNGLGVWLRTGSALTLSRSALVENHAIGLFATDDDTAALVTDIFVARTQPATDGPFPTISGRGITARGGAALTLTRAALIGNHDTGLWTGDDGATAEVQDVLIAGTRPAPGGMGGAGIVVHDGGTMMLSRSTLIENNLIGLFAGGDGTNVTIEDVLVARTQPGADVAQGPSGITVYFGAALALSRSAIIENHHTGLNAWAHSSSATSNGTTVQITETLIARTQPTDDGEGGLGVSALPGSAMTLSRSAIIENHEMGLAVLQSIASVSDTLIEKTRLGPAENFGDGVLANDAVLDLTDVISRDNARAGVLYQDSGGSITSSMATGNAIGLVTQGLLPPNLVADDNVFEGNAQNIMTDGALEIPDAATLTPELPDFN